MSQAPTADAPTADAPTADAPTADAPTIGTPSATARLVAAYRLGVARAPAPYGNPAADEALARDVVADLVVDRTTRMAGYLTGRTSFFDRVVVNGIERGVVQIASLGAGYDGRALRYAADGVRWFDVDLPATQNDKRARLSRLEIAADNVTFVPVDLTADDVAVALTGAGFDVNAPSLLLVEGVANYLTPEVLGQTLARLRSLAAPGTRVALSTAIPGSPSARRSEVAARFAAMGEPILLADGDVPALLVAARWRSAELSEKATRAGLIVGLPEWIPGQPPTRGTVGAYLERTFHRDEVDDLAEHLQEAYAIHVTGMRRLDVGVFRIDRDAGEPWVARVFPALRPGAAVESDVAALRYLADQNYPAERPAHPNPVSALAGQAVLVTDLVSGKRPPATLRTAEEMGALLGRLHTLPDQPPVIGGGWHHLAVTGGGPTQEIAALRELLSARSTVAPFQRAEFAELHAALAELDDLADLPYAFTHPDFVAANAVVGPRGLTLIDWTGVGRAPRLASLGFLLWAAGQDGARHVDATVAGYRRHQRLTDAEVVRLHVAITHRPLLFAGWSYATGREPLAAAAGLVREIPRLAAEIATRARAAFTA